MRITPAFLPLAAFLLITQITPASATSQQWDQTGPQGHTYSLSSTITPDIYGPFVVLLINLPPEDPNIPATDIHTFANQILTEICHRQGGTPSIQHVEESSRNNQNNWIWKGQQRSSWSFVRHCTTVAQ